MFANTLSLTINGVAKVLNRINQDNYGSEYSLAESDQSFNLKIRHTKETSSGLLPAMVRHNVLLKQVVFATPTTNAIERTVTTTIRAPEASDPQTAAYLSDGLSAWVALPATSLALAQGIN